MKNSIIILMLIASFMISCNHKGKRLPSEPKEVVQKGSEVDKKNKLVKIVDTHSKVLDTVPPKKVERTMEEYKTNLTRLNKVFPNKEYTWKEIQSIIPTTNKEFEVYYELTYPDYEHLNFFETLDSKIFEYSKLDKGDILFLGLDMAQFTDGEYAGSYSSGIEDAVFSNKEKFCIIYKYLSKDSKWKLESLYKEVCLGIERSIDEEY